MNKGYYFPKVLGSSGWIDDLYLQVNDGGDIIALDFHKSESIEYEIVHGYLVPGMINTHSHAFQYAMAGVAEIHDSRHQSDNFWSWRSLMYQIALKISPDQLEAIATMLYAEMIRHGYTHVIEFHYLHHDSNGKKYSNLGELGERLIQAAQNAGIKVTLIPIYYRNGGFNKAALAEQRRFLTKDPEDYYHLVEAAKKSCVLYDFANVGVGVHSLRAADTSDVISIIEYYNNQLPFHMHISEQVKEVTECMDVLGNRPVAWILDNCNVQNNYNFVHATHMTESEARQLARSGAQVILCPSTEGNLGDGFFSFEIYQKFKGNWNIGTDSHVSLNPFEELRILDYGQRLRSHNRMTFKHKETFDSGLVALQSIINSGIRSTGLNRTGNIQVGEPLDGLVLDANHPLLATAEKSLASSIVYASDPSMYLGTLINGKWVVKNSKHKNFNSFSKSFVKAIQSLDIR